MNKYKPTLMPFWGNIISHKFLAKHTQSQQNNKYNDWTFTEKQLDSKIKTLNILNCPKDVIIYQLNENTKFSHYFCERKEKINKTCDLLIFFKKNCFVIDVKSNSPDLSSTWYQLQNSKLFICYLNSISENFFHHKLDNISLAIIKTGHMPKPSTNIAKIKEEAYKKIYVNPTNEIANIEFSDIKKLLI